MTSGPARPESSLPACRTFGAAVLAPAHVRPAAAFVMSPALGDTLNLLVVAHNLACAGWRVQVYGDHAHALAHWFPRLPISPALAPGAAVRALESFQVIVQMHRDRPLADAGAWHKGFIHLHEAEYADNDDCMAKRFAGFAAATFGLPRAVATNGMQAPPGRVFRRHARRVAIHPEASSADKRWLPARFIALARRLERAGFEPVFVMHERERARWPQTGVPMPALRSFDTTTALADWLYECGWFIGNDSGVGHLASSLGVPTLSVFRRKRVAHRWRPGFAPGAIVYPPWWLPTAALKERWWRESISVARLFAAFCMLRTHAVAMNRRSALEGAGQEVGT